MTSKNIDSESLGEEFYQVSPEILASFPKFRLPLNLYRFREDIGVLEPFYYANNRLDQNMQKELHQYCQEGQIFVSRHDHKIYAQHISKQLDLILVDKNLTSQEIVYTIRHALTEKTGEFFEQPVPVVLENLRFDVQVTTQYIWDDPHRINSLLKMLWQDYSWARLCYNSTIIGMALFIELQGDSLRRKHLDQLALGLATHLVGLTKVPKVILEKKTNLSREEKSKLQNYPMVGATIMRKLDVLEEIVLNCHLEHKELLDGTGYPRGLKAGEMSLYGKLASLVHTFSEMITKDSGASADIGKSLEYLARSTDKYDSKLVKKLLKSSQKIRTSQES